MKKTITIILGLSIILSLVGCTDNQNNNSANNTTQAVTTQHPQATEPPKNTENEQKTVKATIDGIRLGDSLETLRDRFGAIVKETPLEEPNYMGDNISKIEYKDGATLFVDKDTNTILEITVEAGNIKTNLGATLGDTAEDIAAKYGSVYQLFKGDNSDDKLQGWYIVEEGELLIFDFKKGDDTHYNGDIDKAEKVVSITLSHPKYFD